MRPQNHKYNRTIAIMRKLFTLFLTLVACVGMMQAYDFTANNLYFNKITTVTPNEAEVTYKSKTTTNPRTSTVVSGTTKYNEGWNITTADIPRIASSLHVTRIGAHAFESCTSLSKVVMPYYLKKVDSYAFSGCSSLKQVHVTSIEKWCEIEFSAAGFNGGILGIQYYPPSSNPLRTAHHLYVNNAEVTSLVIPETVTTLNSYAFLGCQGLTSVTMPNTVTTVGNAVFSGCTGLTSPVYNAHVFAFMPTTYSEAFSIPEGISSIAGYACTGCSSLPSITIPQSVTTIGEKAFYYCSALESITCAAVTPPTCGAYAFSSVDTSIPLYVPYKSIAAYQAADGWKDFTNIQPICPLASGTCGNNLTWELSCDSVLTISGTGAMADYTDFSAVPWNANRTEIKRVVVSNGVTSIGNCAFESCGKLTSVEIGNSVTKIGDRAFFGAHLLSVTIPENVTSIGKYAFYMCSSMASVELSNGVQQIGEYAFAYCAVESMTIPNSVTTMGNSVFCGCTSLASVTLPEQITKLSLGTFDGCTALSSIVIPSGVQMIEQRAFYDCTSLTTVDVPSTVTLIEGVAFSGCTALKTFTCSATIPPTMGYNVFDRVELSAMVSTRLYVPYLSVTAYQAADQWKDFANIQHICPIASGTCGAQGDNLTWELSCEGVLTISGTGAMADYSIESHAPWYEYRDYILSGVVENGVTSIGDYTFSYCTKMTSIEIPASVTSVEHRSFYTCHLLKEVHYSSDIADWCSKQWSPSEIAFEYDLYIQNVKISDLIIPDSVTSIEKSAFYGCSNLTSIVISNSVTNIGISAFSVCRNLISIRVTDENPTYDSRNNCNAIIETGTNTLIAGCRNTVIPNGVTSIGYRAFYYCDRLTSIEIPASVTSIGNYAFLDCSRLTSITLPNGITSIGDGGFWNCGKLSSLTCEAVSPPTVGINAFSGVKRSIPLYIYCASVNLYKSAKYWSEFTNVVPLDTIPFNLDLRVNDKTMGSVVMMNQQYISCDTLQMDILARAHDGYQFIQWNDGVLDTVRTIIVCKDTVSFTATFEPIKCLLASGTCGENITWELSCDSILTFSGTGKMTDEQGNFDASWSDYQDFIKFVIIEEGVTNIGEMAFYNSSNLISVAIPQSITSIGADAFYKCNNLIAINVATDNPTYYSEEGILFSKDKTTLRTCPNGKKGEYTIPDYVTKIANYAFHGCEYLTAISIPSSITYIGSTAFSNCAGLNTLTIPNSVESLGNWVFAECKNLQSVTIGKGVINMGDYSFMGCSLLTSIDVDSENQKYCSIDGLWYNKEKTRLIKCPSGKQGECIIPNSVTNIVTNAFSDCNGLTSLICYCEIPPTLGNSVFYNANTHIIILYIPYESIPAYKAADQWKDFTNILPIPGTEPCILASGTCGAQGDNLTWELSCDGDLTISGTGEMENYESYAPWHEYYTRTLTVEEGVTTIGRVAFIGSQLEEVHLGSTVTRIGEAAFEACTLLRNVQLQENLKVIEFGAFQGDTLLESVVLPNSVDSIGNYAFAQCRNLTAPIYNDHIFARLPMSYQGHYITPEGISQIAGTAFETCEGLTEVTFSSTIEEIGDMAFSYCSALTSVNLSPFIGTLKSGAFYGCSSLTTAHLGKNMQKILYNPFDHCEQFTTLTLDEENPYFTLDKGILYSKDKTRLVLCPTAKQIALNDLSTTITSVAPGAMFFTTNVDSIAFPEGVTLMGDRVLVGSSVKYIVLPSTLDSIGDYALSIYHENFQAIVSYAQAPPKVAGRLFVLSNTPDTLYVPFGAKEAYQNANGWSVCPLIVELPNSCTPVSYSVHGFSNDSTLGTVRVEELPEYVGFTATEASTIKMQYGGTVVGAQPKLEYSYDGSSWNTFSLNTIYNVAEGQTFFLRGDNPNGVSRRSDAYSYFVMTGSLEGSGDIMTLVDSTGNTKTAPAFSFYYLFRNCTALTKAPKLNATILNTSCYLKMFYGCTNLRYIEVDFTSWKGATDSYNYTQAWLSNASSEGTFVKLSDLTVVTGTDAIPAGWTVVKKETGNTDADSYKSGAKIKLTAEPKENCHFVKWSDNIETNPRTFVLTQDTTFTAIFEKDKCILASGTCGNNLTWELSCDSVLTISGTGEMTSNPWSTNYKTQIKEVVIKDGVTSIAHAAFFYCSNLQSATIPNSVATIYNYAFSECNNLTSLTLPDSVTSIGQEAFSRCTSLTTIEIPSSVTSIGNWAFAHCVGLTSVIIPNSVTSIGSGIFGGCSGITEIQVAADNNNYCSVDGVLFNKDQTTLVQYPCGKQGNYAIPNTVTTIGDAAFFAFKGQISITIPNSVTSLGDWAFDGCTGLTSITCEALTPPACGADEFYGVDKSIPVYVPYESIAAYQAANQWSEFTNILPIPGTDPCAGYPVTADDYATICSGDVFEWYGEAFTESVAETTVFDYTRTLTTINGCDSVVTLHLTVREKLSSDTTAIIIKGSSFNWHGTEYTAADPAPTYWYQSAVTGCDSIVTLHIEEIDPPCTPVSGTCGENLTWEWTCDSVLTISGTGEMGSWLYSSEVPWLSHMADIKAVVLPEGLTNIAVGAFNGCSNLTSIVIPSSVTSIGHQAFKDCSQLSSITMSSNVTIFEDYAFKNCAALTSIDMPEGLTSVGKQAFFGCTGLTSVVIPDATTTIGELAFFGCTGLADVTMGDHVESIAYQAFYDCQSISSMALPSSLTTIGAQAFYGCTAMSSVSMGNNVTSIGEKAFDGCSSLNSINLSTAITAIEAFTFFRCGSLTAIELPENVTSIGESAFQYCSSLASITVPEGVTNIGTYAFHSCTDMTSATFLGDVPSFGSVPFGGGNTCLLHVPCGTSAEYASAANVAAERVVKPVMMDYSVTSEDEARGSVSILERPTCEDQTLTIQAEANEGYQFYRWNDDATDNPYTLVLTQDTTLEAMFLANTADGIVTDVTSTTVHLEWEMSLWGNHGYWIYIYIDKDHKHWYCKMRFNWLGILDKFYWGPASRHYDPSEPNHVAPRQVRRMPARYYTDAEVISYDLTDLDDDQEYFFILEEVDEFEKVLSAQAGMFVTPKKIATDIDNVQNDHVQCTKKWINGHLYILRGEHIFDAQGHQVK